MQQDSSLERPSSPIDDYADRPPTPRAVFTDIPPGAATPRPEHYSLFSDSDDDPAECPPTPGAPDMTMSPEPDMTGKEHVSDDHALDTGRSELAEPVTGKATVEAMTAPMDDCSSNMFDDSEEEHSNDHHGSDEEHPNDHAEDDDDVIFIESRPKIPIALGGSQVVPKSPMSPDASQVAIVPCATQQESSSQEAFTLDASTLLQRMKLAFSRVTDGTGVTWESILEELALIRSTDVQPPGQKHSSIPANPRKRKQSTTTRGNTTRTTKRARRRGTQSLIR